MHFDLLHTDYETSQGLGRIFKFIESTHEIPTMIGLSLRWKSDATLAYSFTGEFGIGSRATFKPRRVNELIRGDVHEDLSDHDVSKVQDNWCWNENLQQVTGHKLCHGHSYVDLKNIHEKPWTLLAGNAKYYWALEKVDEDLKSINMYDFKITHTEERRRIETFIIDAIGTNFTRTANIKFAIGINPLSGLSDLAFVAKFPEAPYAHLTFYKMPVDSFLWVNYLDKSDTNNKHFNMELKYHPEGSYRVEMTHLEKNTSEEVNGSSYFDSFNVVSENFNCGIFHEFSTSYDSITVNSLFKHWSMHTEGTIMHSLFPEEFWEDDRQTMSSQLKVRIAKPIIKASIELPKHVTEFDAGVKQEHSGPEFFAKLQMRDPAGVLEPVRANFSLSVSTPYMLVRTELNLPLRSLVLSQTKDSSTVGDLLITTSNTNVKYIVWNQRITGNKEKEWNLIHKEKKCIECSAFSSVTKADLFELHFPLLGKNHFFKFEIAVYDHVFYGAKIEESLMDTVTILSPVNILDFMMGTGRWELGQIDIVHVPSGITVNNTFFLH